MTLKVLPAALAAAASTLLVSVSALAVDYTIDPDHTSVKFEVSHLGFSTVEGKFKKFDAKFNYDPKAIDKTTLDAWADVDSLDTDVAKRDGHLKSEDFFDAAKYPKISFKSTKVEKGTGEGDLKVTGDFTMHGVTKPVTFDVKVNGPRMAFGASHIGFKATTTVNREDFKMTWNKVIEGSSAVGKEVTITINGEGGEAKAEAAKDTKGKKEAAKEASKDKKKK